MRQNKIEIEKNQKIKWSPEPKINKGGRGKRREI